MDNFKSYFLKERRVFLENINYETVKGENRNEGERRLGCRDTVVSQLISPIGVKIIFNRRLNFEPEAIFTLSVSFGVFMLFDPARRDEVDWNEVNIVKEFTKDCPEILTELTSRATLLTAQITSAAGNTPIITAVPVRKMNESGESPRTEESTD
ncbi:MAG: hypothetical protein HFE30_03550 [Clostridiales bacterium]|nr:hypothetical protein [Clostridiales bacterium]